jgi:Ni/Co efflux regulator RcnB
MKTITATLAALLLAGAGTAALAQDREHDRGGERTQPQAHPQGQQAPQGGHARAGAPPGSQAAPVIVQQRHDSQGQRFQGAGPGPAPSAAGPQRFDRGAGPGPGAGRQFDQTRGPREVIPPSAAGVRGGDRGFDNRRDGHVAGAQVDARNSPWRGGERWQPGRAPPVFWSHDRFRVGAYRAPYGYYVRTWGFGEFLPRGWYGENYWVGDFLDYGLPYPPPGYEWVRVGGDALMIDRYTGRIVQVVRGIFW